MEMMTLSQLASYLHRDARDLSKLANRGKLPGQKIQGEWRFSRTEINYWLETQLPSYTDKELTVLETGGEVKSQKAGLLTSLLQPECVAVPLRAGSKPSVIKEMVNLGAMNCQVYDPDALIEAITRREDLYSTALPSGVAIPHPHRPLPAAIEDSMLIYSRTGRGIPFGCDRGVLTDIFFMVACSDEDTHVKVMARLVRLLLRPDFIDSLREADTPEDTIQVISDAEQQLVD